MVFDLDETLVHCNENPSDGDVQICVSLPSGDKVEVIYIYIKNIGRSKYPTLLSKMPSRSSKDGLRSNSFHSITPLLRR